MQILYCVMEADDTGEGTTLVANSNSFDVDLPKFLAIGHDKIDFDDHDRLTYDPGQGDTDTTTKDISTDLSPAERAAIEKLIDKFKHLFNEKRLKGSQAKNVKHHIVLEDDAIPIRSKPYRVPQSLEIEVEAQIKEMLQDGIIRPSSSPYSSPIRLRSV